MTTMSSGPRPAPELLAPAGNWECAQAAIENGADAIYFGLQVGFNARARAANFSLEELPALMDSLHQRSVRGYVTLNTLVFTDELYALEANIRRLAEAGVDAVLVQDLGGVRLIRETCPGLAIHASTQMTMVSAETIHVIESLGIERVVLARELSIKEIAKIAASTAMPLECFVHGALCVAYSGQCLTSESLGGRSANRGQCAQACRLNYTLHSDGKRVELGDNQYLLSPQDLAGIDHIPELIKAGVCSFKIEGRLKTPEYVANTVGHYRHSIDNAMLGQHQPLSDEAQRTLEMSFSRGFSPGWLDGCDHKRLVPGLSSAKRGVRIGRVVDLRGEKLLVDVDYPIARGDGIVLEGNRAKGEEVGGRIYDVIVDGRSVEQAAQGRVEWLFQRGLLKNVKVHPGQAIWQTDDPQLSRTLKATYTGKSPNYRRPIDIEVDAIQGHPLRIVVRFESHSFAIETSESLAVANKHSIDETTLREQLGRLGGSPYFLRTLTAKIDGKPMIPFSVLGKLRRDLLEQLAELHSQRISFPCSQANVTERMLSDALLSGKAPLPVSERREPSSEAQTCPEEPDGLRHSATERAAQPTTPTLHVLCRSLSQLEWVLADGVRDTYVDFHDIRQYREAVEMAHGAGATITLASLRIQKPGEMGLFQAMAKHPADGWLVRNLAALRFAKERQIPAVGDFSLNVTNPLTAEWLVGQGLSRCTASYDLNRDQLMELVESIPKAWLEVVIHQHIPMFHMEHCVFCTVLSPGTNKSNCGRPCDRHLVQLEDRIGVKHVLHADIGCRNTLYNGVAQSGAEAVANLLKRGIRHFRIELLQDSSPEQTQKLIRLYRELIGGRIAGSEVWKALKADNRVGVTRGTLEHPRNPLAIL